MRTPCFYFSRHTTNRAFLYGASTQHTYYDRLGLRLRARSAPGPGLAKAETNFWESWIPESSPSSVVCGQAPGASVLVGVVAPLAVELVALCSLASRSQEESSTCGEQLESTVIALTEELSPCVESAESRRSISSFFRPCVGLPSLCKSSIYPPNFPLQL